MRLLLFSHTTGYQLRAFNDAAERLGIELEFATDRCHRLDDPWQDRAVPVRFYDLDASVDVVVKRAASRPVDGVIAVGDRPVVLAARAAEVLGLPWHSVQGAMASSDKRRSRAALAAAGLPAPQYVVVPAHENATAAARVWTGYPCVLKPVGWSGSRGVIRADQPEGFSAAFDRIRALLARPQVRAARAGLEDQILVETYIPGREFALEGVVTDGVLRVFAIFDKPDPLDGPFFEETIYVTPSTLSQSVQADLVDHVQRGVAALGLRQGPVHAEVRVAPARTIYVREIAARPIGGLCSRVLSFSDGNGGPDVSLETVLLLHAVRHSIDGYSRDEGGAAVMMIPIPRKGMLKAVNGADEAWRVPGVSGVHVTAKIGQVLEPLPEAGSYLGFIFARGATAADAEASVRAAHRTLDFEIAKDVAVNR